MHIILDTANMIEIWKWLTLSLAGRYKQLHENGLSSIHGFWNFGCEQKILSAAIFYCHYTIIATSIGYGNIIWNLSNCAVGIHYFFGKRCYKSKFDRGFLKMWIKYVRCKVFFYFFLIIYKVHVDGSVMVTFIQNWMDYFVLLQMNCKTNSQGDTKILDVCT